MPPDLDPQQVHLELPARRALNAEVPVLEVRPQPVLEDRARRATHGKLLVRRAAPPQARQRRRGVEARRDHLGFARSHCRLRNRGTAYVSESDTGMKWVGGGPKR